MKFRVITAAFDTTKFPPEPVRFSGDHAISEFMGEEIIDTATNELFDSEYDYDVHDIEDQSLHFWNRLNPSSCEAPFYTHNGSSKVVVIDVRPYDSNAEKPATGVLPNICGQTGCRNAASFHYCSAHNSEAKRS